MTIRRNNGHAGGSYSVTFPSVEGRPGMGKLEARYDADKGWHITLTPNQAVLDDPDYLHDWNSMVREAEYKMRLSQVQEFEPGVPIPPEIEKYLETATAINNDVIGVPESPDHSYTIDVYSKDAFCERELYFLLQACREISFTQREDGPKQKMFGYLDEIMLKHQEPYLHDYMFVRAAAANSAAESFTQTR